MRVCLPQGMKDVLGPWTDIPAPDIGTDERVMAWIFDEFSKHKGFSPAVTTGKVGGTSDSLGLTWLCLQHAASPPADPSILRL